MQKKREMDMCEGSLWSKILIFSIPLILTGILQLLFNAADIVVVGRFAGEESLAAVGSTTSFVNLTITPLWPGILGIKMKRRFRNLSIPPLPWG